mmetsp:Transcript_92742/g.248020  ORF Transcript_92742/g.248020 Transcript_92742/m.248020 type:complete len:90 (+) Transcript_92742:524-793(+)
MSVCGAAYMPVVERVRFRNSILAARSQRPMANLLTDDMERAQREGLSDYGDFREVRGGRNRGEWVSRWGNSWRFGGGGTASFAKALPRP